MPKILAQATRGKTVENRHWGSYIVVDVAGGIRLSKGDKDRPVFFRSTVKPFHTLAVIETGAATAFGLTDAELAVITASHGGEEIHLEAVHRILAKLDLAERDLGCGPQTPFDSLSAKELLRRGEDPRPIHCNCSGNHAGILAICRHLEFPVRTYLSPEHPVHKILTETVAQAAVYPATEMGQAIDGCGLPVQSLPLYNLALAYARLGEAKTVLAACRAYPYLVGGRRRFISAIIEKCPGIFAKDGADGLVTISIPDKGLGLAIKIEDGAIKAAEAVAVELLNQLGILSASQLADLRSWHHPEIKNTLGEIVGELRPLI